MSKVGLLTLVEIPADISHVLKDACDVLQKPRACFDYLSIPLLFSVGSQYSRDHNGRDYTTFFPRLRLHFAAMRLVTHRITHIPQRQHLSLKSDFDFMDGYHLAAAVDRFVGRAITDHHTRYIELGFFLSKVVRNPTRHVFEMW